MNPPEFRRPTHDPRMDDFLESRQHAGKYDTLVAIAADFCGGCCLPGNKNAGHRKNMASNIQDFRVPHNRNGCIGRGDLSFAAFRTSLPVKDSPPRSFDMTDEPVNNLFYFRYAAFDDINVFSVLSRKSIGLVDYGTINVN